MLCHTRQDHVRLSLIFLTVIFTVSQAWRMCGVGAGGKFCSVGIEKRKLSLPWPDRFPRRSNQLGFAWEGGELVRTGQVLDRLSLFGRNLKEYDN